jgi:hypothetical protein
MGVIAGALARVSLSDLLAVAALASGLYGLHLLHPAAPWIGAAVALGFVAVEVGKREAKGRD